MWIPILLAIVIGYLLGNINGAICISKLVANEDVRNRGSGNAGLTNFIRNYGTQKALSVVLIDGGKAVLACVAGGLLLKSSGMYTEGTVIGGVAVLVGHMFPFMFKFKGGKGVLSGGTIAIMIDWRVALVVWGGFIILVALTRYVSLGSCWAGASFPFATWFVFHSVLLTALGVLMGWSLVYMHRANIKRLLSGTESKFSFRKKKS